MESRHLGLVTAAEVKDLQAKMQRLAQQAEKTIDLDAVLSLSQQAPPLTYESVQLPHFEQPVRIAVAQDRAFCFYYQDSLDVLRRMGAELVPFSPLTDAALPEDIQGLYLGGGYPELYAAQLSDNLSMRQSVGFVNVVESKNLILRSGMPYIVAQGRKGGSNVAAAICNALLYQITR